MKKTRYTEKEMRAAYLDWQQSGLSKKAYCTQFNLPCSTFHYWTRKLGPKELLPAPGFLELKIPKTGSKATSTVPEVEIEYPSGVKIKLSSLPGAAWIKSLA